jgi:hypothetical protein
MSKKRASFLERKPEVHARFGHLVTGVKSKVTNEKCTFQEENKMEILMQNLMDMRCDENDVEVEDLDMVSINEQTDNSAITYAVKVELAMINKIFPNLLMNQIASIQPLDDAVENIFYMDFIRDSDSSSLSTNIHDNRDYADNVEYDPDNPTDIASISMTITSDTITTTEKKLKASITIESLQDLRRRHGKNAESLLTNQLAREVVREWDRMGIQAMYDGATGGSATFSKVQPPGLSYEDRKHWMETLYEKICDVDNAIFKKRFRRTNFLVVGADEANFIEKMNGFKAIPGDQSVQMIATGGRYYMGTLKNRWRVYVDPLTSNGKILVGYNNPQQWEETSFVFAPYILSYLSPWFVNPNTLRQTRAILSRAGMKVVIGDLLGVVEVTSS